MTLYGVYESELRTISMLNVITTFFTSVGTGLLTFMVSVIIDLAKDDAKHPDAASMIFWVFGKGVH